MYSMVKVKLLTNILQFIRNIAFDLALTAIFMDRVLIYKKIFILLP
jgi:hypothetical protein